MLSLSTAKIKIPLDKSTKYNITAAISATKINIQIDMTVSINQTFYKRCFFYNLVKPMKNEIQFLQ